MALAHTAMAQDANVTTGATSAKLGGEFRAQLTQDDHGFEKVDGGEDPNATTTIAVHDARIKLSGNINKDTEYAFRFNLLNPGPANGGPLDYGYGTHWLTKSIGFSMGRMKVAQGGWDNWNSSFRTHARGVYADNLVFRSYEDMIEFQMKMDAGTVRLQVLNDVSGNDAQWNTDGSHPTWVLGWNGAFGPVKPMLNIGSYDNNKSRWIDLGVATEMNGLTASLDVYMRNHVNKVPDGDKSKGLADDATAITLYGAYTIKGTATPFLYFSTYDNKQGEDSDLGMEDMKVNSESAPGVTSLNWDDNGQTIGVGANLEMMGNGWNPFVAYESRSGKFDEGGEEKTKSNSWIKLGVLGEI